MEGTARFERYAPARRGRASRAIALAVAALACGAAARAAAGPVPTPIGVGASFHPPPGANAVRGLECEAAPRRRYGVHLELFARGLVVLVPAGVGVQPPLERRGAYVLGGRCSYPVRTMEPTGVIEVAAGARLTLGQFFDVWGQPLSSTRLAGFSSSPGRRVVAFVAGRRFGGDPRAIPLRRHAEIVLELGAYVPPHASYRFPKGL